MRTVLLVTDLEGIAGVDTVDALLASSPDYPAARELLTAEVVAAVDGLRAAGYERIRVSDSHRPAADSVNVIAARLPPCAELDWRGGRGRDDDAFAADLFAGVEAVACLGMHAAAGTRGFAAHTVHVHCAWSAGGRNLSETDLFLGLAAETGVPVIFVSGDDVLGEELGGAVPYVLTKTATSDAAARSRPPTEVHELLRRAAAGPPVAAPPLPDGPWALRFKSRWTAAALARAGARRVGETGVELVGATVRARYQRGLALLEQTVPPLVGALRKHAPDVLREDIRAELARGFDRAPPPATGDAARRALARLLELTDGDEPWQLSERALTLHMLETHAPAFFAGAELAPILERAVARLVEIPRDLPLGLPPYQASLRVDAVYVRASRGLPHGDLPDLVPYVRSVADAWPLYAWMMWEMAAQIGLCPAVTFPTRPLRSSSRWFDLYWLTHLFLLATRFLRVPLDPAAWEAETEELALAVPWALAERRLDLAAELAFCLQLAGEADTAEHAAVLAALLERQRPDGSFVDNRLDAETPNRVAHTTLVALLAFARSAAQDQPACR